MSEGGGTARLPRGVLADFPVIMGHRDVGLTTCPGKSIYAQLPSIRAQVTAPIADAPQSSVIRHWRDLGATSSVLGAVTSKEYGVPGGVMQNFARGQVFFTVATGPRAIVGPIMDRFRELGGPPRCWGSRSATRSRRAPVAPIT